jgi:flagellar motor switch protein FliN
MLGAGPAGAGWSEGVRRVAVLEDLKVDLSVVLGRSHMPLHMLLRMGRGAVIELEATESDMVEILANDHPIARGQIVVTGGPSWIARGLSLLPACAFCQPVCRRPSCTHGARRLS